MKVGIISSVSIDHATPAVFYSNQPTRKNYYEIGMELANSGFDFFGGGGIKKPTGDGTQTSSIETAQQNGYTVVTEKTAFQALKPGSGKILAYNSVLDGSKALWYEMDRPSSHISLAEFTEKAIELLDNKNGFFMMVEGGKIDWAHHANDAMAGIMDTIAFDNAVKEALDFYEQHPNETLIVITADHECGGLTVGFANTNYELYLDVLQGQTMSYEKFDEVVAEYRSGSPENTVTAGMKSHIEDAFGLDFSDLTDWEIEQLEDAYTLSMAGESYYDDKTYYLYGYYEPLTVTCTHILNRRAGLAFTSYAHTGVPVPVYAKGIGAGYFDGFYDNTDIALKIAKVMRVSLDSNFSN